jgi:hypothetical protein
MSDGLWMRRTLSGLAPADERAAEQLRRVALDARVRVTLHRPRNMKLHARYWVLCDLVSHHHQTLRTKDQVDAALRILAGHADVIVSATTGEIYQVPKSLKLSELSGEEFEEFYRRACDAAVEHLLPGVSLREVQDEVLRLVA